MNAGYERDELPVFREWRERRRTLGSLWRFLGEEGGVQMALAFSALFWPDFLEVDGRVTMRERLEPRDLQSWLAKNGEPRDESRGGSVEVHLWDLFNCGDGNLPDEALQLLAGILAATWQAALEARFPGRGLGVAVAPDAGGCGPILRLVEAGAAVALA